MTGASTGETGAEALAIRLLSKTATRVSRDPSGRIWRTRNERFNTELDALDRMREALPDIFSTMPPGELDVSAVATLFSEIGAQRSGQKMRWQHNYLLRFLKAGEDLFGWPAQPYSPVVRLRERGSPLNKTNFPLIARFRRLRSAFLAHWSENGSLAARYAAETSLEPEERERLRAHACAQVLASAVLFGGLMSPGRLLKLADVGLARLDCSPRWLWVDWPDDPESQTPVWTRWIADRLSALLIAQARVAGLARLSTLAEGASDARRKIYPAMLRPFLESLDIDRNDVPSSLTALMEAAQAWGLRHLPPFLVEYGRERLPSASLPPGPWRRIVFGRPEAQEEGTEAGATDPESVGVAGEVGREPRDVDPNLRARSLELRNILRGIPQPAGGKRKKEKHALRGALLAFRKREDLPVIIALLAEWAYERLDSHAARKTAPSVVLAQCLAIDRLLIDEIGFDDPRDFTASAFEELYDRVREGVRSTKTYNRRSGALAQFHAFLVARYGVDGTPEDFFDGVTETGGVDANLFTEAEYRRVRERLAPEVDAADPFRAAMRHTAFTLAVRCKMRRSEIKRLRLADVLGEASPILMLSHRSGDQLKSSSAQRLFRLAAMFEPAELEEFRAHVRRIRETLDEATEPLDADDVFLFHDQGTLTRVMPEEALFGPIQAELRRVTGNPSIREHHCRHAGLNQDSLLLMEQVVRGCSHLLADGDATDRSARLLAAMIGTFDMNSQHLWASAFIAGHLTPEVTIGSYLHLNCWLLHCAVERELDLMLVGEALARQVGLTAINLRVRRNRYQLRSDAWFAHLLAGDPEIVSRWKKTVRQAVAKPGNSARERVLEDADEDIETGQADSEAPAPDADLARSAVWLLKLMNEFADRVEPRKSPNSRQRVSIPASEMPIQAEQLARIHRMPPDEITRRWTQVKRLERIEGTSRSRAKTREVVGDTIAAVVAGGLTIERPVRLPRAIKRREEQEIADRLYRKLLELQAPERERLEQFLAVFWRYRSTDEYVLRVPDPDAGNCLVGVLESIDGGNRGICNVQYTLCPASPAGGAVPRDQLALWAERLGLAADRIELGQAAQKTLRGKENGVLEIRLRLDAGISVEGQRKRQRKGATETRAKTESGALEAASFAMTVEILKLA